MEKQVRSVETIRKELDGKACPFCGWVKYQLVLRSDARSDARSEGGGLFARCSRCQKPRDLAVDLLKIKAR
ncbi:MAG: hypothetical protein E6K63_14555 [Nitrospirae bacterium]|nr:MAG: hypothetical protein E6K63_14555 [Nitrospirota bacterium]